MTKIERNQTDGVKYESPVCSVISLLVNDTVLVQTSNPNDWISSEEFEINGRTDIFDGEL